MDELCSIASAERSKPLPWQIPPEEVMLAMSPSLNSILDVELSLNNPGSFPRHDPSSFSVASLPDPSIFLPSK